MIKIDAGNGKGKQWYYIDTTWHQFDTTYTVKELNKKDSAFRTVLENYKEKNK